MTMMMINYMVSTWATLKVLLIMTQWHDMTGEHETMCLKSLLQISFLCPQINYSISAKQHFGYAINQHQNRNAFFCKLQRLVDEETIKPTSKKQNAVLVMKMIDGHFDSSSWWPRSSKVRQWNDIYIGNDGLHLRSQGYVTRSCWRLLVVRRTRVWRQTTTAGSGGTLFLTVSRRSSGRKGAKAQNTLRFADIR